MKYFSEFQKSDLLSELKEEFLVSLSEIAIEKRFQAGEILFLQGQDASGFYLSCSGQFKVFRIGNDGREQVIHLFEEGEVIGEVPVFQGIAYPASAMAVKPSKALFFPTNSFLKLSKEHPEILLNLLAVLCRRLRQFVELIDDLSLKDVTSRLAKHLINCQKKRNSETFEIEGSKGALASRIGTISATLSRTFKKLQQLNCIKVENNKITIISLDALEAIAEGEKAP